MPFVFVFSFLFDLAYMSYQPRSLFLRRAKPVAWLIAACSIFVLFAGLVYMRGGAALLPPELLERWDRADEFWIVVPISVVATVTALLLVGQIVQQDTVEAMYDEEPGLGRRLLQMQPWTTYLAIACLLCFRLPS